jgi:MFS family permease
MPLLLWLPMVNKNKLFEKLRKCVCFDFCFFSSVGAILSGLPCSYVAQLYNWRAIFIILEILAAAAALFLAVFGKVSPGLPGDKPKSQ